MNQLRQRKAPVTVAAGAVALMALVGLPGGALSTPASASTTVDPTNAASARSAYQRLDELQRLKSGWTGSTSNCQVGTVSAEYQAATLEAINIYRGFSGLDPVTENKALSAKSAQSSLMMQANNSLNHNPPSSWKCYTADGAEAARSGNLSIGAGRDAYGSGPHGIAGQMDDSATPTVGHRRWLMRPQTTEMGIGNTSNANTVYVIGTPNDASNAQSWVSWPSEGYFPEQMLPTGQRNWSVSAPTGNNGHNFSNASVKVTGPDGRDIATKKVSPSPGYANDTLVWQMPALNDVPTDGVHTYRVEITGIRAGSNTVSHSYEVKLVDGKGSTANPGPTAAPSPSQSATPSPTQDPTPTPSPTQSVAPVPTPTQPGAPTPTPTQSVAPSPEPTESVAPAPEPSLGAPPTASPQPPTAPDVPQAPEAPEAPETPRWSWQPIRDWFNNLPWFGR